MKQRKLGKYGPELSVIGFGAWAIGGAGWDASWGAQDDRLSIQSVYSALDAGITFFDTAAVYGLGHSEEIIGKALKGHRHEVVLATKCGLVWDEKGKVRHNGSYESILREAENSLRRLGTDYIDLYQMHWPDTETKAPAEETMRAMEKLVQDGKVRYVGLSNYDVPLLERSMQVRHVDALQPPYSILRRQIEQEILPYCARNGIGVVAYSPLSSGLLSGNYTEDKTFDEDDWRGRHPEFQGEGLRRNLRVVEQLRPVAERLDLTVPQLAVAWVLAHPTVTSAIVGVRKPGHITGILKAAEVELDEETLAEIRRIAETK